MPTKLSWKGSCLSDFGKSIIITVNEKSIIVIIYLYTYKYIFAGNTERQILSDIENIVDNSLPSSKLEAHFQDTEAAKLCIFNKIALCEARQKVI